MAKKKKPVKRNNYDNGNHMNGNGIHDHDSHQHNNGPMGPMRPNGNMPMFQNRNQNRKK